MCNNNIIICFCIWQRLLFIKFFYSIIACGDDMAKLAFNNLIKKTLTLLSKKGRDESGLFLIEGERFVSEIPHKWPVEYFIISESFARKHDLSVYEKKARVYIIQDYQYKKLSDTVTPQGIMAICRKQEHTLENLKIENCLLLLCEALADPGNAGMLIRTANAAGASGVILTGGCAELYSPKVIRAAAGALFHIPCIEKSDALDVIHFLKRQHVILAAAHLKGCITPYNTDMKRACCIMIGNEASGLSPELTAQADIIIKIPMKANAESLNAAAAGSILLYEAVRQRGF